MPVGALGVALFALHVALLFLPPLPPIHNGFSVPSYLLGNVAVLLVALEAWRTGPARVARLGDVVGTARWRAGAFAVVAGALGLALLLRAAWPDLYYRWWREEGVFEPVTLLAYAGSAALLWRVPDAFARPDRRAWRGVAAGFLFLALEEVDYFGIFGGMIGRIDGEYAGALHDVIRLLAVGAVGAWPVAILGAAALVVLAILWRAGIVRPFWLLSLAARPEAGWVLLGVLLLAAAAIEEAGLLGWVAAQPTPEEAVEMAGGLALATWAIEAAARLARSAPVAADPAGSPS